MHRQDLFRKQPILRELLTEEGAASTPPSQPIVDPNIIQTIIAGQLPLRLGMSTRDITAIVLSQIQNLSLNSESAHQQVKAVALNMRNEGRLYADEDADGFFLQLRKSI
jgi:hypothetical protein